MDSRKMPKISVITISFNSVSTIEETIKSVIGQTYPDIEFIVLDGGSTDGTVDILNRYRDKIDILRIEPDKGIYDAMNKGINLSSGEWINFMNSNDYFYNEKVIEDVFSRGTDAGIIYGYCIDPDTGKSVKPLCLENFWKRIPVNHQSAFVKADYYKEHPYKLEYTVSYVYDFFYVWYCKGIRFKYIDIPVAVYDMKGISFYSFAWLWDYLRISLKYSKGKRIRVLFRFVYLFFVRVYINLFLRRS